MRYLFVLAVLLLSSTNWAQAPRKLTQDPSKQLVVKNESKLVLPPNYDASKKYPLVIFLPFTGGSGTNMFSNYAYQTGELSTSFSLGGTMMELDLSPLIDSLNGMPTDAEINAYMDKLIKEKMNQGKKKKEEGGPEEEKHLTALLKGLFGNEMDKKSFMAMLPDGSGSTADHDWKGFSACIYRYENRILKDIETFSKKYSIDKNKIILVGYSLGGDLSWAITNRYPEKFMGAVISGSRCSYSEKGMIARLAKKNARYYIAMGENESATRMKGAKYAKTLLTNSKIQHKFVTIPGGGHDPATYDQFKEAVNFVLFE